ncbi:hypothetical protein JHK85_023308 [Glycine max]|nr:hypothetical protein JHK85_023308 [Glycine max]
MDRGREGDKRIGVAAKLSSQLDRIIQTFESSVSAQDPTSIIACVAKLKDLLGLERGRELFYKATKLMKKRANKIFMDYYIDSDEDGSEVGPSTTTWEEPDAQIRSERLKQAEEEAERKAQRNKELRK